MENKKVVIVMPAFNAAKTLKMTYDALPKAEYHNIILVDDGSSDETIEIAKSLGLTVYLHSRNFGYGANQKTCYSEALKEKADIIVMLHPDYQYEPSLLPEVIKPIREGAADMVLGSRLLSGNALKQGMPWWKYISNRFLTYLENKTLGLELSEYHTGYRAYSHEFLEKINFLINSDKFVFDQEVIFQAAHNKFRILEIAVPTKYFPEASSASFYASCIYGISILFLILKYLLHKSGIVHCKQFDIFKNRYRKV